MDYNKIFPDMVASLAKDGDAILASLTPANADLWHGATGVAGEAGELLTAILYDKAEDEEGGDDPLDLVNIVEELGDMEFYLEMVRTNLGVTRADVMLVMSELEVRDNDYGWEDFARLAVAGSDLLDAVKKIVVYNKQPNFDVLVSHMAMIEHWMTIIRTSLDITRDEVIEANVTKLATGPNARYKHGYTDQAAQDRADKAA